MHAELDPVLRPLGFTTKSRGPATWKRKLQDGGALFIRVQTRADAFDPYAGGRFRVQTERSRDSRPYTALAGRADIDQLLAEPELQTLVDYQNTVIRSLPRPPADWVAGYPQFLRETYLQDFEPDRRFRPGDLWFRFLTMDHVDHWARLIGGLMPIVVERAHRLSPGVMYMGSTINLDTDPLRPTDPVVIKPRPEPVEPPDLNWRPAPRGKRAQPVCGICGKPILQTEISVENVGHPGIFHFQCKLGQKGSGNSV